MTTHAPRVRMCALVACAMLSILCVVARPARAAAYAFVSLYGTDSSLSGFTATTPSMNSAGVVAFAELVFDAVDTRNEYVVYRHDGVQASGVLSLTDAVGVGSPSSLVINDAGVIAVSYSLGDRTVIVRVDVDGSFVVLAEADVLGNAPYRRFAGVISMNGAGQVAALVTNHDQTSSIVRLDGPQSAAVEIARSSATLAGFSSPTVNDVGVVAFTAQDPVGTAAGVYTGAGGPLTLEATCSAPARGTPIIDNHGVVLFACDVPLLGLAGAGSVNVVVSGTEDPIFGRGASSQSLSNRGHVAFVTRPAGASPDMGLFTGNDAVGHKVVRTGDVVLGRVVEAIGLGHRAIDDAGRIVLLLQLGGETASTHVVVATPPRRAQAIAFAPLPDRVFGDPPFVITASASSGLPVTLAAAGTCTVAGQTVSITGAGSCTIVATQVGSIDHAPAADVARTFAIARAGQSIAFAPLANRTLSDPPLTVAAVASSGLPVTFAATGACALDLATVRPTGAGACTVTASQAGDGDYDPAVPVAQTFLIDAVILATGFDSEPADFRYLANAFRGTTQSRYASGSWLAAGGFKGGAVQITLGGVDNTTVSGMSGGWQATFVLSVATKVMLHVRASVTQTADYESDERSQFLVSVDGVLVGTGPNDFVTQVAGDGNGGTTRTTGWRLYHVPLGTLAAGTHTLVLGGYNSKKTTVTESTTILIDDVRLLDASAGPRAAVAALDFARFKDNIRVLAQFGDRTQGTPSNDNANLWLESQLRAAGYTVERHGYTYQGQPRHSVYATKIGSLYPDQMYIVSAHMDGRGGGGAANDDASGCSLVLEAARALARLQTAASVRFVFWNNEETGLNGSTAYVNERAGRQGVESPAGSGLYPEPRWLGIIQHDQILYDHGLPPQPAQIPGADIDIEYQASSTYAGPAQVLAHALRAGNQAYSSQYPAQVGSNMNYTDSVPFRNHTAAVSVRDNQRIAEIGQGSNPHWHQPTDVYAAFSEADFRLGFNAVQMTLGTVAELAGAMPAP